MKKILILLVSCLITCCNTIEHRNESSKIINVIRDLSPNSDFSKQCVVLIIPFDGCSSCFDEAVHLISEVSDKQNIIIMPSRHKRRVFNFINEYDINANQIIIDTVMVTVEKKLVDINPVLFLIENHALKFMKTIEYENMKEIRSIIAE